MPLPAPLSHLVAALKSPAIRGVWRWVFGLPLADVALNALAVSPWGSAFFPSLATICAIPLLAALPAVFLLPLWFFSRRGSAFAWWLVCLVYVPLGIVSVAASHSIRSEAFHRLALRSGPLVAAIHDYTAAKGSPPESLEQLTPEFLPEIPKTGMRAYPGYRYLSGPEAARFEENPWVLFVDCTSGGINFDRFYYFPLQNYPEHGYGGGFQRMHDWAYLHE